jgi:hypothetical protein
LTDDRLIILNGSPIIGALNAYIQSQQIVGINHIAYVHKLILTKVFKDILTNEFGSNVEVFNTELRVMFNDECVYYTSLYKSILDLFYSSIMVKPEEKINIDITLLNRSIHLYIFKGTV